MEVGNSALLKDLTALECSFPLPQQVLLGVAVAQLPCLVPVESY